MKYILSVLIFILAAPVMATPVGPMSYQGRLLDDNGIPVTGSYDIQVDIYNDISTGVLQYSEEHTGVLVDDGVYALKVGTQTPITGAWDIALWQVNLNDLFLELSVKINGGGAYETLTPRHELTSAPHAFTSTFALSADALGNKTAAQYDNILEGVCAAGKGKWLDLLNTCLGVAAVVSGETLATMMQSPDTDFTDLDLREVDLTDSNFNGANFSNTIFKNTTLSIDGFANTNMTGTTLDGVSSDTALAGATAIDFTDATLANLDPATWNLDGATLNGLSSTMLANCPASLPTGWSCLYAHGDDNDDIFDPFLVGPYANLSAGSAMATAKYGAPLLDFHIHNEISGFTNVDLSHANFEGITHAHDFNNSTLLGTNFNHGHLTRIGFVNANLTDATFVRSTIERVDFTTATMQDVNFENAKISHTQFPAITITGVDSPAFGFATLEEVNFSTLTGDVYMTNSLVGGLYFVGDIVNYLALASSEVVGNLTFDNGGIPPTGWINFWGTKFTGLNNPIKISGDLDGASFFNTTHNNVQFDGNFTGANMKATFTDVLFSGDYTGANFSTATFNNVSWDDAGSTVCPDGYSIPITSGEACHPSHL